MPSPNRIPGINISYGLDATGRGLNIVRAVRSGKGIRFDLVESDPDRARMRDDLGRGRAVTVGALRTRDTVSRWIETPLASSLKARQVLPSLLDVQLPFPIEEAVCQFPMLEKTVTGSVRALALAARQKAVEARLADFREQDCEPVFLDHEGLTLWEQALTEAPVRAPLRVVAFLGDSYSVLVTGEGTRFINARNSDVGFGADDRESASRDFTGKVRRIISSDLPARPGQTIEWIWAGPGAEHAERLERLQENIPSQNEIVWKTVNDPGLFLARALAVRGARAPRISADFRTGSLQHAFTRKKEIGRAFRLAASVTVLLSAYLGLNLAGINVLRNRTDRLQERLTERASQLAPGSRIQRGQEVRTVEAVLTQRAQAATAFKRAFTPHLHQLLPEVLRRAEKNGLKLESCYLGEDRISLKGTARQQDSFASLIQLFSEKGYTVGRPVIKTIGAGFTFHLTGERNDES